MEELELERAKMAMELKGAEALSLSLTVCHLHTTKYICMAAQVEELELERAKIAMELKGAEALSQRLAATQSEVS